MELVQIVAAQSGVAERKAAGELKRLKDGLDRAGAENDRDLTEQMLWRFIEELDGFLIHAREAEENRRVGGADVQ